jgi:hypothetical protein
MYLQKLGEENQTGSAIRFLAGVELYCQEDTWYWSVERLLQFMPNLSDRSLDSSEKAFDDCLRWLKQGIVMAQDFERSPTISQPNHSHKCHHPQEKLREYYDDLGFTATSIYICIQCGGYLYQTTFDHSENYFTPSQVWDPEWYYSDERPSHKVFLTSPPIDKQFTLPRPPFHYRFSNNIHQVHVDDFANPLWISVSQSRSQWFWGIRHCDIETASMPKSAYPNEVAAFNAGLTWLIERAEWGHYLKLASQKLRQNPDLPFSIQETARMLLESSQC